MSTVLGLQLGRARTMIRADEYCIVLGLRADELAFSLVGLGQ